MRIWNRCTVTGAARSYAIYAVLWLHLHHREGVWVGPFKATLLKRNTEMCLFFTIVSKKKVFFSLPHDLWIKTSAEISTESRFQWPNWQSALNSEEQGRAQHESSLKCKLKLVSNLKLKREVTATKACFKFFKISWGSVSLIQQLI